MPATNNQQKPEMIPCPRCGQPIELKDHPQLKHTKIAHHDCMGIGMVRVYESNVTPAKPKATPELVEGPAEKEGE
jgi:hypothetical protein